MLPGELFGAGDRVEYAWLGARGASPSVKLLNGTPVEWNPLSGVDRDVEQIWRQPTPPPPGTHYAWLGEPHASPSVRLDGDGNETARNYYPNPSFEFRSGLSYGSNQVQERSSEMSKHGNYSTKVTATGATGTLWLYEDIQPDLPLGRYIVKVWIYLPSFIEDRITEIRLQNGTSPSVLDYFYDLKFDEWFEATFEFERTENHTAHERFWIGARFTPNNSDAGDYVYFDQVSITTDGSYFDGDTPSDHAHDLWYNQDGVPHEWVNGEGWVEADDRFTPVPDHHQVLRIDTSLHGDIPDIIPGPNSPARELRSIVMIDGVEREHDGWDVGRELTGDLPAQVVSSSGLMQATGTIAFADDTVRKNARNPFNRGTGWLPRRGQEVRIYVEHKDQWFQRFQGVIDKVNGAVGGGLQATMIDGHDRFSAEVNHQSLLRLMPPLVEGSSRRGVGLTAIYYIDYVARAAGYYCTPPRERNTSLAMHGQTSQWPEAGTLQRTIPLGGQSHGTNKRAPWGFALGNFSAYYSPWGGHTTNEPLQITLVVAPSHSGTAYVNVPFETGSRDARLTIRSSRIATLTVGGSTIASITLGDATVVSALIKNGTATLRTNTGDTATGTASLSGGSLDEIHVRADEASAIAGVQVSHPDTVSAELASTYWEPNARIDSGSVDLYGSLDAVPRLVSRKAGNVLNEITDAILTAAWIDETGILQIVPSDVLRTKTPVRTVTTVDDVLSLDWEDSVLQSPSRVTVTAQKPIINTSIYRNVVVWEGSRTELAQGESNEEFVEPSSNEEWVMVEETMQKVGLHSAASMGLVNANRATVGGGYYAIDGEWEASPQPNGFSVTMDRLGVNKYLIRHHVHNAPDGAVLVCGVPKDHPEVWTSREGDSLPRLNAFSTVQWADERVSAVTVAGPGPELTHDAGPWAARPDSTDTIERIANFIAGQTASPQPVIRGLEIFPDPRLQLGDMIRLSSDTLLGVRITALIVGLSEGMDRDGGMTQILTVRISSVTTTADTYLGWEDALASGQVTYSAFNNLPPSPQDYQDFNLFY